MEGLRACGGIYIIILYETWDEHEDLSTLYSRNPHRYWVLNKEEDSFLRKSNA